MSVFTRRNAIVGFVALKAASKALERRRKKQRRSGLRIAGFVALGLVSVGILAGVAAVMLRRRGEEDLLDAMAAAADDASEIVGEYVAAPPESIPAT
jgi:hypothetical protein